MLACIIIVSLAYIWLLWESNYLRVNLCQCLCEIGACSQWRLPDSAVDHDMKCELLHEWFGYKSVDKILRCHFDNPDMQPLFGWGYAYQYRDFKPEYQIQLLEGTTRITINSNSIPHLKDAFKVWRNPYIKVKMKAKC